ncbi:flagellar basal body rod protein FlgB [Paludibacterium denitrificans]|uniref:Flagellar basal body rod protein FlgB n=1 Tax=Paludibacterium denitrificans TaxID=2675226 RepID=A0A844GBA0_9NEIS|nr:flagellar basal body rod protein FlgB [Paludibacterium denitrificans]MTD32909.1 flagellar basal body rod protein FlgB [Paludibacterium denitrificans]
MGLDLGRELEVHADALRLRAERTKILASNIANESTPGYKARDIDFRSSLQQMASGEAADGLSLSTEDDLLYRVPNHPTEDGNTVEIGVEQAEFSQNTSDFQMSLTFINMKIKGLEKAITGNS